MRRTKSPTAKVIVSMTEGGVEVVMLVVEPTLTVLSVNDAEAKNSILLVPKIVLAGS